MTSIERVGVLGAGLMGSGIAEVCARAGSDVVVVEMNPDAAAAGLARITASLERAVNSGKLDAGDRAAALARIRMGTEFEAFADRQLVIEAVPEVPGLKDEAFRRIDAAVRDPEAILASNTSSIPISRIASATSRPEHVLGMHFFNPVPVLKLVELVPSLRTSAQAVERIRDYATAALGKKVITAPDRAGFVVNALLVPYMLSAIRMLEAGFATAEDIDTGMVEGCAHPMGPLRLTDLVGLDTTLHVANSLYAEFKEPHLAPPALLMRMVESGLLGRKSGLGFYNYP
ncbi:3-hydroxybutyryl-CoA dehydrogenase [Arthrobacter silviterrae]|uniref:3-hydroxybutyryl-CoA dehydrogenase n=1 Tax=Arthrobacter silviterrae TaxID=2026658 RepID=A0ABX0DCG3_9MICC|nr:MULTISPECIES: 3-hydroxybutyryl-CoA dehydrogenase [Arthrobacter]MCU6478961.1 3-hydroxybutyryl-CoA dehydrogenase [Arthrobacter sp. A2-55]MDQ0277951.1 3-hydroxybutyryl-CoA dehydrogenase [Arthrobacter silviterrae]NGN83505.1 3-hydroxybutyryl-CoA dehydrogenase [Arthrobacter silviterrae]